MAIYTMRPLLDRKRHPSSSLAAQALFGGFALGCFAFMLWTDLPAALLRWLLWLLLVLAAASLTHAVSRGVRALPAVAFLGASALAAIVAGLLARACVEDEWTWCGVLAVCLLVSSLGVAAGWRAVRQVVHRAP